MSLSLNVGLQWIGEKPMQWFEPKNDGRLIYRQDGYGREEEIDQKIKFFLTRRKATYEQPYGKALLATLYWLYFFKQNGFKFWAKFLEFLVHPYFSARWIQLAQKIWLKLCSMLMLKVFSQLIRTMM